MEVVARIDEQKKDFLEGFDQDIMDISGYFERHIKIAREELSLAEKRLERISEDLGPVPDPFQGDGQNEEELTRALLEVNRFDKKLKFLLQRREEFLANPIKYQICSICGEKIPKERMEEVPHCRHCVKCKNNTHNGNGAGGYR
jgi:RNA polymerase-binding transcription factor DksA